MNYVHVSSLVCASLILNVLFLVFLYDDSFYRGLATSSGEIAYNVYCHNSPLLNPIRGMDVHKLQESEDRIVQYSEIDHSDFESGTVYKYISDTIGYGVILGFLWKLTGSLNYRDIQILQIILYSLSLFLIYGLAFLLFNNTSIALMCGVSHLLFFPGIYLNIYTLRDAWVYYGLIVLLYIFVRYLTLQKGLLCLIAGSIFFALCQFIRPTLFMALLLLTLVAIWCAVFNIYAKKYIFSFLCIVWLANICFFWIPFTVYNYKAHGRMLVSTAGQNFVEGLWEFENPWGLSINDVSFDLFMQKKYGLKCGSLECDDKAKKLFLETVIASPWFYISILIRRLHRIILPGLPWFAYNELQSTLSFGERIKGIFYSGHAFFDFWGRQIYIRLYLLVGYLGLIILLLRKKYFIVFLLFFVGIVSSWIVLFTHVEHRYLIPHYTIFSFFVGYMLHLLISWLKLVKYAK